MMVDSMATIEIPRHLLEAAHATPDELRTELAVQLYQQRRLSISRARELAGMGLWEFRQILVARGIAPHYDVEDLERDPRTLQDLEP